MISSDGEEVDRPPWQSKAAKQSERDEGGSKQREGTQAWEKDKDKDGHAERDAGPTGTRAARKTGSWPAGQAGVCEWSVTYFCCLNSCGVALCHFEFLASKLPSPTPVTSSSFTSLWELVPLLCKLVHFGTKPEILIKKW